MFLKSSLLAATSRRPRFLALVAAALLMVALGSCSSGKGGPSADAPPSSTVPTQLQSPSPARSSSAAESPSAPQSPTPTATPDFENAVLFVRAIHDDELERAADFAAADSDAARYVSHRLALYRAGRTTGEDLGFDKNYFAVEGNESTGEIEISGNDGESYVWNRFKFDGDKVSSFSSDRGSVGSLLWSRESKVSTNGTTARLISAYDSASGLQLVVEISAEKDIIKPVPREATYTPTDGYRQEASAASELYDIVPGGEKTLLYFLFDDGDLGGRYQIPIYPPSSSYDADDLYRLSLKVD